MPVAEMSPGSACAKAKACCEAIYSQPMFQGQGIEACAAVDQAAAAGDFAEAACTAQLDAFKQAGAGIPGGVPAACTERPPNAAPVPSPATAVVRVPFPERVEGLDFGMSKRDATRAARRLSNRVSAVDPTFGSTGAITFGLRREPTVSVTAEFCEGDSLCVVAAFRRNAVQPEETREQASARLTRELISRYGEPALEPNHWVLAGGEVVLEWHGTTAMLTHVNEAALAMTPSSQP
jgi:hypothetical protein